MPFRVTSFWSVQKGFLKIKENILKEWAAGGTVSSKLTSSINQQCRRTVKFSWNLPLSNSSRTRDKRNRHLKNGKPLYSAAGVAGLWSGGREFNGEGECVWGWGWKHQLKCAWFIISPLLGRVTFCPALCTAISEFIFQLLFIVELGVSECILPHSNCWQVQPCNHLAPEVMRPNEMELEEINILSLIY